MIIKTYTSSDNGRPLYSHVCCDTKPVTKPYETKWLVLFTTTVFVLVAMVVVVTGNLL